MKQTLLLLVCFYSLTGFSQKWCEPGATWFYGTNSYSESSFHKLQYEKDTVIGLQACKKIKGIKNTWFHGPPGQPVKNELSNYKDPILTYAQNDTVFIWNKNSFEPVYYFGALKGDTLKFGYIECPNDSNLIQVVDSVGTITINNESLRFYVVGFLNVDPYELYENKITIIEKFGSIDNAIYPSFVCSTDYIDIALTCYSDSAFQGYSLLPNGNCFDKTSTSDPLENSIIVFPNPTNNLLNIKYDLPDQIDNISIYDIQGNLNHFYSGYNEAGIDVNYLPNGFYILQISSKDGFKTLKKFIKN